MYSLSDLKRFSKQESTHGKNFRDAVLEVAPPERIVSAKFRTL
jgi:hypothetical protein